MDAFLKERMLLFFRAPGHQYFTNLPTSVFYYLLMHNFQLFERSAPDLLWRSDWSFLDYRDFRFAGTTFRAIQCLCVDGEGRSLITTFMSEGVSPPSSPPLLSRELSENTDGWSNLRRKAAVIVTL
jgi:hypothetical protein